MDSLYEMVGRKVSKIRKELGFTQQELAEKSSLSIPFVSQIETGKRKASLETYSHIAHGFGITLGELFTDTDKTPSSKKSIPASLKGLTKKQRLHLDLFLKSLQ